MTNKEFFINCWGKEMKRTLLAVKSLPVLMSKLDYKPDPMSRSAKQIIGHILPHAEDLKDSITTKVIDEKHKDFASTDEAYKYYETNSLQLIEKLNGVSDSAWETEQITLSVNGRKVYEGRMMDMFWTLLFDTVHHRGQLSTYYRSMGVRNPSIYGPTAEDMQEMMAAAK
jgi:uncharacterized damage-inducible protein DinB